ncbi:hypothetical protein J1605_022151 [Eschrichtius robustus]|uniref:Uncharacterized protein n=1 Tax=Eschrichtius robustus TaxID=9764 RepID=A0AB34HDZ7_ESCRO|nr:hypothetical protein J1605_022151 [Eschrichtius robustus]
MARRGLKSSCKGLKLGTTDVTEQSTGSPPGCSCRYLRLKMRKVLKKVFELMNTLHTKLEGSHSEVEYQDPTDDHGDPQSLCCVI